ncbi:tetratricopeptide TPR_2 repeat-containing protein [Sporocytophaga myxococcoides]|uniref:Tetratricopeptide TPR_2 repeat-containing protein n=1 Tax=Sporocytophaga myxococcoides TaxID=153721 RepID=A0A098LCD6_9BACT|nr:tetratricopeptide repeat protein [Sporocytophaga myxococcoides]GAL84651.1 tetratricopeptide TPR_2 repeat-containing protein [Sporocytophaga myxococcoides]
MAKLKESKGEPVAENPELVSNKFGQTEDFLNKYKTVLFGIVGAAILAGAGYFFYNHQKSSENKEAQNAMFVSVLAFEEDSLDRALKGSGPNAPGLLDVADEFSGTNAGDLANFYVGVAYLKKGKFEDAISYLKEFNANDLLVQARAYSLIGDAYMELKDFDNAVTYYKKASDYKPNEQYTPSYLMKLALAYEVSKKFEDAAKQYEKIIKDFPKSSEVMDAKKYFEQDLELAK